MTGQISSLSVELAAAVVAASMLIGAIDIARQPGWAWKQVEESKPAYFILVLLLPIIGLAMYAFRARPKVIAAVATGYVATDAVIDAAVVDTAAGAQAVPSHDPDLAPAGVPDTHGAQHAVPDTPAFAPAGDRFTGFREMADNGHPGPWETEPGSEEPESFEVSSTFFSTGVATRSVRHPLALARGYRPKQRTSLEDEQAAEPEAETEAAPIPVPQAFAPEPAPMAESQPPQPAPQAAPVAAPVAAPAVSPVNATVAASPSVPSGWKVDPTARHQFRYWDGFHWTENVADNGDESRDAVVSA